jgi:hypothetical protein
MQINEIPKEAWGHITVDVADTHYMMILMMKLVVF